MSRNYEMTPVDHLVARDTGEVRFHVRERSDAKTCLSVIADTVPKGASIVYTDEWGGYNKVETDLRSRHATVKHGKDKETGRREWARDDDKDGVREVHCNTCERANTGLRNYLRIFRGVHKYRIAEYVAAYETMYNAKRISDDVI